MTIEERFFAKVKFGPTPTHRPDLGPCWVWTASTRRGYGRFMDANKKVVSAHRWLYERLVGPIPIGLEPDHLCKVKACVRPSHIELVTHVVNVLRGEGIPARNAIKTHCHRGHLLDEANTFTEPNGGRQCRICKRERSRLTKKRIRSKNA